MQNKTYKTDKLSIAMVCDPVTDYTAGVFVSTIRFAHLLKERGHNVIFIAARSKQSPADGFFQGIPVYRFKALLLPKTEKSFYISFPSMRELEAVFEKEKITTVHLLLPTPAAILAAKVAKKMGINIISHSHSQPENVFLHLPAWLPKKAMNSLFDMYLAYIYNHAKKLIYPSQFAADHLSGLTKIPGVVISNGIDTSIFFRKKVPNEFYLKFNIPSAGKKLLYVGRLHPEKSVDTLIRSMPIILKTMPGTKLLIVGAGHQEDELKELAQSLGLENSVLFLGKISDEDLRLAYSAADIFVLPSLAELEGMVVLEAMASGLPILIADAEQSASKHFVESNGYLFSPQDPQDLAEKALRMLSNEKELQRMSKKSLENSKKYDIHESVAKIEDVYYAAGVAVEAGQPE